MFDESLIMLTKTTSLVIFFVIYIGALAYVFWKPNKGKFESYGRIPFLED